MTSCRANMLGYIFQSMFRPTLPSSHEGLGDLSPVQWVHVHRKPCTLRDSRADFLGCAPPSMCTSISFCESCEISDAGFESRFEEHFFIIIVRLHDTSDVSRVLFLKLSYLPLYAIFILGKLQTFGCWWVSAWAHIFSILHGCMPRVLVARGSWFSRIGTVHLNYPHIAWYSWSDAPLR